MKILQIMFVILVFSVSGFVLYAIGKDAVSHNVDRAREYCHEGVYIHDKIHFLCAEKRDGKIYLYVPPDSENLVMLK